MVSESILQHVVHSRFMFVASIQDVSFLQISCEVFSFCMFVSLDSN